MNTVGERIDKERVAKGLTKTAIWKAAGVTSGMYPQWVNDGMIPDHDKLIKIANLLNVDIDWLKTGRGNKEAKKGQPNYGVAIDLENNPDYPAIKHVNLKLSAGISGYAIEQNEDEKVPLVFSKDWFDSNGYLPHQLIAVKVSGESMQPVLHDGDTVIINTGDNVPKDSCVYAINYEGELLIKRMVRDQGTWWLSSDNPDQSKYPRKRCDGDYCIVIGRIIHRQSEKI